MVFDLCLDGCECVERDCGHCEEESAVFNVTVSDIVLDMPVPDPPGIGEDCPTCEARNTTYPLTKTDELLDIPNDCLTFEDAPDGVTPHCRYNYHESCMVGTNEGLCPTYSLSFIDISLFVYRSVGGNIRGYLQFAQYVEFHTGGSPPFCIGDVNAVRYTVSAADFLFADGVSTFPCAEADIEGDFTLCQDSIGQEYSCGPPTSFTLQGAAA